MNHKNSWVKKATNKKKYIGYTDKNGDKLYDGDEVVFKDSFPLSIPDGAIGKIKWHESANEWTIWNEYQTIYGDRFFNKVTRVNKCNATSSYLMIAPKRFKHRESDFNKTYALNVEIEK